MFLSSLSNYYIYDKSNASQDDVDLFLKNLNEYRSKQSERFEVSDKDMFICLTDHRASNSDYFDDYYWQDLTVANKIYIKILLQFTMI